MEFFEAVTGCENDITTTIHNWHEDLRSEDGQMKGVDHLLRNIQNLSGHFVRWQSTISRLSARSQDVPPVQVDSGREGTTTARCHLETKEIHLEDGDEVTITDASKPNMIKVRTSTGEEGYVPALSCLMASPDSSPATAIQRLQIYTLATWSECLKLLKKTLVQQVKSNMEHLTQYLRNNGIHNNQVDGNLKSLSSQTSNNYKQVDLTKMHENLSDVIKELHDNVASKKDTKNQTESLATMTGCILFYLQFDGHRKTFMKSMKNTFKNGIATMPDDWKALKLSKKKSIRYYEIKMTKEIIETVEEETTSYNPDKLSSDRRETRKRIIIRAVIDPRTGEEISFQDSIKLGIMDQDRGKYVNIDTGEEISIPEAMTYGKILIEM